MVYGSGLENRQSESSRGFESHPLRRVVSTANLPRLFTSVGNETLEIRTSVRPPGREAQGSERSSNCGASAKHWQSHPLRHARIVPGASANVCFWGAQAARL